MTSDQERNHDVGDSSDSGETAGGMSAAPEGAGQAAVSGEPAKKARRKASVASAAGSRARTKARAKAQALIQPQPLAEAEGLSETPVPPEAVAPAGPQVDAQAEAGAEAGAIPQEQLQEPPQAEGKAEPQAEAQAEPQAQAQERRLTQEDINLLKKPRRPLWMWEPVEEGLDGRLLFKPEPNPTGEYRPLPGIISPFKGLPTIQELIDELEDPKMRVDFRALPPAGPLISRNVIVDGRRTSMRLEISFWNALRDIARREKFSIHDFCTLIDAARRRGTPPGGTLPSLSGAIRMAVIAYYREMPKVMLVRLKEELAYQEAEARAMIEIERLARAKKAQISQDGSQADQTDHTDQTGEAPASPPPEAETP